MLFIAICTEGEVSEPTYIDALKTEIYKQMPGQEISKIDFIVIPLNGNQGHSVNKIIERANNSIKKEQAKCAAAPGDDWSIEKWLILDYDKLEKDVNIKIFKQGIAQAGFELIINKPNFEYFVLLNFMTPNEIDKIKIEAFEDEINNQINKLNKVLEAIPGLSCLNKICKYNKHKYNRMFYYLLRYHSSSLNMAVKHSNGTVSKKGYLSEMSKLINRLDKIYNKDN